MRGAESPAVADISVVIPTIGRAGLLGRCLESIAACETRPAEVLVVDQSRTSAIESVVNSHRDLRARVIPCDGVGIAVGTNLGLRAAQHAHVAVTHDDCTVDPTWVGAAARHARAMPRAIVSGRVLPVGPAVAVPSTRDHAVPFDFTGLPCYGVLYPANMVLPVDAVLDAGGFDERPSLRYAAEDNDLCYRWLTNGGALRFEPELVVWHHDWRSPEELESLYVRYARGQGAFYGKHLSRGDLRMIHFVVADMGRGLRSLAGGIRHKRPRWQDERRGLLPGLPGGLWAGFVDELRIKADRFRALVG